MHALTNGTHQGDVSDDYATVQRVQRVQAAPPRVTPPRQSSRMYNVRRMRQCIPPLWPLPAPFPPVLPFARRVLVRVRMHHCIRV